jgi:hypothetical protein
METKAKTASKIEPKTVTLSRSYEWGSETISEVVIYPPTGKHLRKLPAEPRTHDILEMVSSCSGISSKLIDDMEASDCVELAKTMGEFL